MFSLSKVNTQTHSQTPEHTCAHTHSHKHTQTHRTRVKHGKCACRVFQGSQSETKSVTNTPSERESKRGDRDGGWVKAKGQKQKAIPKKKKRRKS